MNESKSGEASSLACISITSIFPEVLRSVLDSSILRRAQAKELVSLETSNLRDFAVNKHKSVDDSPYGGAQGMLFTAPVLKNAYDHELAQVGGDRDRLKVIYPHPRGLAFNQTISQALANWLLTGSGAPEFPSDSLAPKTSDDVDLPAEKKSQRIWIICGRYEGIDERFVDQYVDLEVSMGDFIVTGAELPALTIVDAITRLLPGVLGDEKSARDDSFSSQLLEYPQYTRPAEFVGQGVPEALMSGNHKVIEEWKLRESLMLTAAFRPDLIRKHDGNGLPYWAGELLKKLQNRIDLRS